MMVSLTNPRTASILAVLGLVLFVLIYLAAGSLPFNVQLILVLLISSFILFAAYNFASKELQETAGAQSSFELGIGKVFSILLFAVLITVGYDVFFLIIVDLFIGVDLHDGIVSIVIGMVTP